MAAASEPHASPFSAAELEFLAEDEMIEIVPNLRMDPLNFISTANSNSSAALVGRGLEEERQVHNSSSRMDVRSLIEDIKDVRFHKIGTGLEIISKERTYALRLKNLSAMEANIVRPFITRALETFYKLSSSEMIQDSDHVPNRQAQPTNRGPRCKYIFISMNVTKLKRTALKWYFRLLIKSPKTNRTGLYESNNLK
ncbi:hypothetical protein DH2020_048349 [Rehmannia glutinosa]|uniref:Uncharacterized protein n=1 Tax=Rehmannia glutinosa TaxID=99300 RepID=A0ABR0U6P2_REHGL